MNALARAAACAEQGAADQGKSPYRLPLTRAAADQGMPVRTHNRITYNTTHLVPIWGYGQISPILYLASERLASNIAMLFVIGVCSNSFRLLFNV